MSPEAQAALINAGRFLRLQIADAETALHSTRITLSHRERHLAQCQARLDEIEAALAGAGLTLPPARIFTAA